MRRLGRGLESLIQDIETVGSETVSTIKIEYIKPNKFQPRKKFDPEKLMELSESIKENGLIQPIVVCKHSDTDFELIAGERRLQAYRLLNKKDIPVYIKEVSEKEKLILAIVENVQREDLSPIEEAHAYQQLIDDFDLNHQNIAKIMNKDRTTISNSLRLLKLSPKIQTMIESRILTPGHARAILTVNEDLQEKYAEEIIEKQYTVRKAEDEARYFNIHTNKPKSANVKKIYTKAFLKNMEVCLSNALGLQVKITERKNAAGDILIKFNSKDILEKIVHHISESKSLPQLSESNDVEK